MNTIEVHILRGGNDNIHGPSSVGLENINGTDGINTFHSEDGLTSTAFRYTSPDYGDSWTQKNTTYLWRFLSNPTTLNLDDNELSSRIQIPFDFNFYGNIYDQLKVSSNGFLTFNLSTVNGCCIAQELPDTSSPNNLIAGFWQDIDPSLGGTIRYSTEGTFPGRRFILEFYQVHQAQAEEGDNKTSFQIVINE